MSIPSIIGEEGLAPFNVHRALEDARRALEDARQQRDEASGRARKAEQQNAELRKFLDRQAGSHAVELVDTRLALNGVREDRRKLESQAVVWQQMCDQRDAQIKTLRDECSRLTLRQPPAAIYLDGDTAGLMKERDQLKAELAGARRRLDAQQSGHLVVVETLEKRDSQFNALAAEKVGLEETVKLQDKRVDELSKQLQACVLEGKSLRGEVERAQCSENGVKRALGQATKDLAAWRSSSQAFEGQLRDAADREDKLASAHLDVCVRLAKEKVQKREREQLADELAARVGKVLEEREAANHAKIQELCVSSSLSQFIPGETMRHPLTAQPDGNAPVNLHALADYWDFARERAGEKPSQEAADLRVALGRSFLVWGTGEALIEACRLIFGKAAQVTRHGSTVTASVTTGSGQTLSCGADTPRAAMMVLLRAMLNRSNPLAKGD